MKQLLFACAFAVTLFVGNPSTHADPHQSPDGMIMWFEIPVTDMNRAVNFYNKVLTLNLTVDKSTPMPMAFFPPKPKQPGGALIQMSEYKPGAMGPVVYLNGGDDLQPMLDRVEPAGGKVLIKKTLINPTIGYFALFLDTEGNRLGMFSPK